MASVNLLPVIGLTPIDGRSAAKAVVVVIYRDYVGSASSMDFDEATENSSFDDCSRCDGRFADNNTWTLTGDHFRRSRRREARTE